jgi:hypothetical protein
LWGLKRFNREVLANLHEGISTAIKGRRKKEGCCVSLRENFKVQSPLERKPC